MNIKEAKEQIKNAVTARGWEDLSKMIKLYERHGLTVDQKLTAQYLQNPAVAREFAVYYDLYNKYKSDYQIEDILSGTASASIRDRARAARFDERLSPAGAADRRREYEDAPGSGDRQRDSGESAGPQAGKGRAKWGNRVL